MITTWLAMGDKCTRTEPLLKVKDLEVLFRTPEGISRAVNRISFHMEPKETLGIVGESGCGKSVTALAMMRLIQEPPGSVRGKIMMEDHDLLKLSPREMRRIRGNRISMIFQEPMTSLNPVFTVATQLCETIRLHQGLSSKDAVDKAVEMLKLVGLPSPETRIHDYPHQLSGGMRQRVMIAMALCCKPDLLIADEPTTALDVTIQAQILELMVRLQNELGMAIMFISHDLGVIAELARRVLVFYAGNIVEKAEVSDLFQQPLHPYTGGLIESMLAMQGSEDKPPRLPEIPGTVPNPYQPPGGCVFHPRCNFALAKCRREIPALREVRENHHAACWLRQ